VIERSADPILHLDYTIDHEDPAPFPGELADSRTHQFFAFCRQWSDSAPLPSWISLDDVQRSELASLIAPNTVASEDILDTSTAWSDCFVRITADADRRPITFAVAEQGVDWDLAEVPVGVYQLAGYTFQPPDNRWSEQRGFVKIADDLSDPEQDLPAAFLPSIHNWYWWPYVQNGFDLCVDVLEPATAEVEWARLDDPTNWQPLGSIPIDHDGLHELAIEGPDPDPDAGASNVIAEGLLRVRLVDAMAREYTAQLPSTVYYERCNGHCGGEPPNEDPPDEEDTGEEDPASDPITSEDGCACSHEPSRTTPLTWLLLSAIVGLSARGARARSADRDSSPKRPAKPDLRGRARGVSCAP
jgi:hypothetical protein